MTSKLKHIVLNTIYHSNNQSFTMFTEDSYEKALLGLFSSMGYQVEYGPEIDRDYTVPVYESVLETSVRRLNPGLPDVAISEAIKKLRNIDTGDTVRKNEQFMDYLQNGVEVSFYASGEVKHDLVYLADFERPEKNDFRAVNQWTFVEKSEKRADIIVFLNGLPIVLIELKSPSREEAEASNAYKQIRNYLLEIPSMFTYNVFCVMSDMACSKAGTITAKEDRYMEWKTKDGQTLSADFVDYDTFFEGMFFRTGYWILLRTLPVSVKRRKETQRFLRRTINTLP